MSIQVIVEATDINDLRSNPTAIELSSALTFAHRLINKALSVNMEGRGTDEFGSSILSSEPALVNFHISEIRNGSVIINGIIDLAQNSFVQGVAGGVIANIITPGIAAIARRTKRIFIRSNRASAGRKLTVTIVSEKVVLRTHCNYAERKRTEIFIHEENK